MNGIFPISCPIPKEMVGVVKVLVTQLCLTLCDPMDSILPGSSVQGDSPGKNTGVSCLFLTQGLNPDLSHCRQILYHLSHQAAQECWNG